MNGQEIGLPISPVPEALPLPSPHLPDEEHQAADEAPPFPISPPPMPWPRVFPSL